MGNRPRLSDEERLQRKREYRQRPEVKAKQRERSRNYISRPEIQERYRTYNRARWQLEAFREQRKEYYRTVYHRRDLMLQKVRRMAILEGVSTREMLERLGGTWRKL